mmetsp:Transcript_53641/g.149247  ORF Transcript_53641/g.149247 Transcript_53641/m.149247 type:complete len:257 (-) Transcript_53641:110-880(-)
MNPQAQAFVHPQGTFGLRIQNPRVAVLTRRVLILSIIAAILVIAGQAVGMFTERGGPSGSSASSSVAGRLFSIGIALLVPCCGYFGAKNNDRNLTCCFCGCSFLGGCCSIILLATSFFVLQGLQYIVTNCAPAGPNAVAFGSSNSTALSNTSGFLELVDASPSSAPPSGCPDLSSLCGDLPQPYTQEECYHHVTDALPNLRSSIIIAAIIAAPTLIVQCLSFCMGYRLWQVLKEGEVIQNPPAHVATAPVHVQPGA